MKIVAVLMTSALVAASASAFAQVYRWTDESGKVHYSERPGSESAREVKNRQSSGASVCDADCRRRMEKDAFDERLQRELRSVPSGECTASYHVINNTSKQRAEAAVSECKMNYAMSRIDPNYKPSTNAQEASRRQNQAVDQAFRDAREEARHRETQMRMDEIARTQRAANEQAQQAQQAQQGPEKLRLRNSSTGAQTDCTRSYGGNYNCR